MCSRNDHTPAAAAGGGAAAGAKGGGRHRTINVAKANQDTATAATIPFTQTNAHTAHTYTSTQVQKYKRE